MVGSFRPRSGRCSRVPPSTSSLVRPVDPDRGTYSWYEDTNRNGNFDAGEYESAERALPEVVEISAHTLASMTLTFGSKGTTRSSGSITLQNAQNQIRSVRIFGGTGNVTVD